MKINRGQIADLITRIIKNNNNTLDTYLGNAKDVKQSATFGLGLKFDDDDIKSLVGFFL